jgi:DnaJ-class molecular chaperone
VSSPAGSQNIEINIPAGIEDGAAVRYPRLAPGGIDLVVMFRIRPEHGWTRQDDNIIHDITLDIWDLILGRDVEIQTLTGKAVIIVVPPMTEPGAMLRVRGFGLPRKNSGTTGDLLIRVAGRLPKTISSELTEQIRSERDR